MRYFFEKSTYMFEKSTSFSGSYESPGVRNLKMNETISSLKIK